MAFNFPNAPVLDDVFTDPSGIEYTFNGTGWTNGGTGGGGAADFLPLTGGTITGLLAIDTAYPAVELRRPSIATTAGINSYVGGVLNWSMALGDANGDFLLNPIDDAGNVQGLGFAVERLTGNATFRGNVSISNSGDYPQVIISAEPNFSPQVLGLVGGNNRWTLALGDGTAENGSDEGSQFSISSWSDSGTFIGTPLLIHRGRSDITLAGRLFIKPTTNVTYATLLGVMNIGWAGAGSHGISMRPGVDDTNAQMFNNAAGTVIGNIYLTPTAVQFNTGSAAELKEDLKSFDAGNIIDQTKVYDFAWRSTGERAYGVIAQEANTVYPQAVTHQLNEDKTEWWGIDYSKYVPVLLQELKALRARVAEQAADIVALKAHTKMPSAAPRRK